MLRKRSIPVQKDQSKGYLMSHSASGSCFSSDGVVKKTSCTSFLNVHGHHVGFSSKNLPESDAVRSPTSPLDKVFSSISNSFLGSPRSTCINGGRLKCWDSSRVGLGLVDSLNDETEACGMVLGSCGNRNIVFGSQMRLNISIPKSHQAGLRDDDPLGAAPKSLPHDYGILSQPQNGSSKPLSVGSEMAIELKGSKLEHKEFGLLRSCSVDTGRSSFLLTKPFGTTLKSNSEVLHLDSENSMLDSLPLTKGDTNFDKILGSLPISIGSPHGFISLLSASEIEQSEDYTCIISHGPNPKMTHIFGDCILESHSIESTKIKNKNRTEDEESTWLSKPSGDLLSCFSDDSLSFCFCCKKKLEERKDICMYRDEKAFCSRDCSDRGNLIEEKMEKQRITSSGSPSSSFHEETFLEEMALALQAGGLPSPYTISI